MKKEKSDHFSGRYGFILACIGSAVGMGNLWRFPVLVSAWGGMTFLIPYVLFVILIGSTGVAEEIALGRSTKSGPIGAFGAATEHAGKGRKLGEGIGIVPVIGSLSLAIGYTCVVGWIFKYVFMALSGQLIGMGGDLDKIGGTFGKTASSFGNNFWLTIALVVTFFIMAFGVAQGIEKSNRFMMPILFFLLVILAIYVAFQPGASGGYRYIFTMNPKGLLDPRLWIFAFGQAFFSLSVAGNGTVIYGAYLPDEEDIPFAARNVALFDTIAALLASFVIIPAMATAGAKLSSGGPGLMFIYLVNVLNQMPGGRLIGIIFFVCVLFAGLSSLINMFEAPVATLQQQLHMHRLPAVLIIGGIGLVVSLLIQGIVSQWMDVVSIYICPLGALIAGIMFFWVFGKKYALAAVNQSASKPRGTKWYTFGKYVYCGAALLALIAGAILGGIG
ncbi:MAG: sodium-dependent transporter [Lachnospiraceae bacterium]|nr:sodium-dependent transporter [Lachnospiraceae bacterium]